MRDYSKYSRYFTKSKFHQKTNNIVRKSGEKILYNAFLLYFIMKDDHVPVRNKALIVAILGYFIFPFDTIPDFLPVLGFSDDLSAMLYAISLLKKSITPTIIKQTKEQVDKMLNVSS
jgi:uncharacterized membrane protein YkvA (DUF1232 family)